MGKLRLSLTGQRLPPETAWKGSEGREKLGMNVEQQHDTIGVLTSSIDASKVAKLHQISGVSHVEEERAFAIAPGESSAVGQPALKRR